MQATPQPLTATPAAAAAPKAGDPQMLGQLAHQPAGDGAQPQPRLPAHAGKHPAEQAMRFFPRPKRLAMAA